jgi:hypothetical protein
MGVGLSAKPEATKKGLWARLSEHDRVAFKHFVSNVPEG